MILLASESSPSTCQAPKEPAGTFCSRRWGRFSFNEPRCQPQKAPDSCCLVVVGDNGGYIQHYFDSRGTARLYAMTFDGRTWTLEGTAPDFSPLDFHQRFVANISDDGVTIGGEWQSSGDGQNWTRDFGLTYSRIGTMP